MLGIVAQWLSWYLRLPSILLLLILGFVAGPVTGFLDPDELFGDLLEEIWEKSARDDGLRKIGVRQGEKVLEVGFGTGHGVSALAQAVCRSGRIYGIDLSTGMARINRARLSKLRLAERVSLACGDALQLPFTAEFFDAIFNELYAGAL